MSDTQRTTFGRLNFSAPQELLDTVQKLAETEGSNTSRVVSDLIRTALTLRESKDAQNWLADRLERAVDRLERLPHGQTTSETAQLYEQHLIGAALGGDPVALAATRILTPDLFELPVHRATWACLQQLGDAADEADLIKAIGPMVAMSAGSFAMSVAVAPADEIDAIEYLTESVEASRSAGHIDRAVIALVDAALVARASTTDLAETVRAGQDDGSTQSPDQPSIPTRPKLRFGTIARRMSKLGEPTRLARKPTRAVDASRKDEEIDDT